MIVAMQNVRWVAIRRFGFQELHDGALEEDPAIGLVGIVLRGCRIDVQSRSVEESIVTQEDDVDGRTGQLASVDVVWNVFKTDRNKAVSGDRIMFETELIKIDDPVTRNHDRHRNAEFFKCNRKRADNVAQSADLGEGDTLGGDHHYMHGRHRMKN